MGSREANNWKEQYQMYRYFSLRDKGEVIDDRLDMTPLSDGTLSDFCTIGVNLDRLIEDYDHRRTGSTAPIIDGYFKKDNNGIGRFYDDENYENEIEKPWYNTRYRDILTDKLYHWTGSGSDKNEFKLYTGSAKPNTTHHYNMSGLKINELETSAWRADTDMDEDDDGNIIYEGIAMKAKTFKPEDFGMTAYEINVERRFENSDGLWGKKNYSSVLGSSEEQEYWSLDSSGGLAINIGKFLEIDPGPYTEKAEDYYEGGKVSVRIGKGLVEDSVITINGEETEFIKMNRIKIFAHRRSGLRFEDDGALEIGLQTDGGLAIDDNGRLYVVGIGSKTGNPVDKDDNWTDPI